MKTRNMPSRRRPRGCGSSALPANTFLRERRRRRLRETDDQQRAEDDHQSPPLGLLQRLLQPELANHSGEENDGTTNHLPDAHGNPQETHEHDKRRGKITESRHKHLHVHVALRALVLRMATIRERRKEYRILSASSGFSLILRSFTQALIYITTHLCELPQTSSARTSCQRT